MQFSSYRLNRRGSAAAAVLPVCFLVVGQLLTDAACAPPPPNVNDGLGRSGPRASAQECGDVFLDITVSPRLNRTINNLLEIYWETKSVIPGDWVGLFDHDPAISLKDPLFTAVVESTTGTVLTDIEEKRNSSFTRVFNSNCLGFWAAYVRSDSGEVGAVTCLSTEPRWMEKSWNEISRLSLANLFLPGTHNSAAFREVFLPYWENVVHKYTYNQELNVLDQLLWGARVLDLRIAHYANTPEIWWCNHDFVRLRPLKEVLQDVKLFLDNTKEIVILDIHNFPVGFKSKGGNRHVELLDFLEQEIGTYLAPASLGWGASLNDVRDSGRRAVLGYNSQNASASFTWPPVRHKWGNINELDKLKNYFISVFDKPLLAPWAAMAELTAQPLDVLIDLHGGLREMAAATNPSVTSWFRGPWGRLCHIVSVDFIRSTSMVKTAINWNKRRAGYQTCFTYSESSESG